MPSIDEEDPALGGADPALLEEHVAAFEASDVPRLTALLRSDAWAIQVLETDGGLITGLHSGRPGGRPHDGRRERDNGPPRLTAPGSPVALPGAPG